MLRRGRRGIGTDSNPARIQSSRNISVTPALHEIHHLDVHHHCAPLISTSTNERTMPRSGLDSERRVSRTVTRIDRVSPGNTGLSHLSSSQPGEPRFKALAKVEHFFFFDPDGAEFMHRAGDIVFEITAIRG